MLIPMSTGLVQGVAGGWDLSTASYDSVSFLFSSQDGTPYGVTFKLDGLKMYMVGLINQRVYQYSLSTAWDISTASYDSKSFVLLSQDSGSRAVSFSADGSKMYSVGTSGDAVYQYSLSTAWDISTASYDSVSLSVSGQDTFPACVRFKSDGSKMYILGVATDAIYQYSLSTAWDISTASYDSVSFSVTSQEAIPISFFIGDNGSKMYVVGVSSGTVYQYSLSTAWDLSTASYDSVSFSVTSQEATPFSVNFNEDGSKLYISGGTTDRIYQYSVE